MVEARTLAQNANSLQALQQYETALSRPFFHSFCNAHQREAIYVSSRTLKIGCLRCMREAGIDLDTLLDSKHFFEAKYSELKNILTSLIRTRAFLLEKANQTQINRFLDECARILNHEEQRQAVPA